MQENLTEKIGLTVSASTMKTLEKIEAAHGTPAVRFSRLLVEAACKFYDEHGFFSFPVRIEPETFQAGYVAEMQTKYGKSVSPAADRLETDLTKELKRAAKKLAQVMPKSAPRR